MAELRKLACKLNIDYRHGNRIDFTLSIPYRLDEKPYRVHSINLTNGDPIATFDPPFMKKSDRDWIFKHKVFKSKYNPTGMPEVVPLTVYVMVE